MKNLNTVFPFYTDLYEQNRFKSETENMTARNDRQDTIHLILDPRRLLPFVIRQSNTLGNVTGVICSAIFDRSDIPVEIDISENVSIHTEGGYDYVVFYPLNEIHDWSFDDYIGEIGYLILDLQIGISSNLYYSETFIMVGTSELYQFTKLEFWNATQLANIRANAKQFVYVPNKLKVPSYPREDEGDKKDGLLVPAKKIVQKERLLIWVTAPEFVVDALVLLPLMDYIYVTPARSRSAIPAETITPQQTTVKDPEYIESYAGTISKFTMQFIEFTVIKQGSFVEASCGEEGTQMIINRKNIAVTANVEAEIEWDTPFSDNDYTATYVADIVGDTLAQVWAYDYTATGCKIMSDSTTTVRIIAVGE